MRIFELAVNIFEIFLAILFVTEYFGCKYKGLRKYIGFLAAWVMAFAVITALNRMYVYEGILGLGLVTVCFLYALLLLRGDVCMKFFIACTADCMVFIVNISLLLIFGLIFNKSYTEMLEFSTLRIIYLITTKLVLAAVFWLLLRAGIDKAISGRDILPIVVLPMIVEVSLTEATNLAVEYGELTNKVFIISLSIICTMAAGYYILIKLNDIVKMRVDYIELHNRYEADKKHMRDVEDLYKKTMAVQHDMKNHFIAISNLMDNSPQEAKEYINSVSGGINEKLTGFIHSDNEVFNAIVNAKIAVCEHENIKIKLNVMEHSLDMLEKSEIGTMFGNMFDNAIEAARKTQEKYIYLEIRQIKENTYILMKNSIRESVLLQNEELNTTKEDKEMHGYGVNSIREIVKAHKGTIGFYEAEGCFCCEIFI